MTVNIKICGITTAEDAKFAEDAGATYLGLNFSKQSPRCINLSQAKLIMNAITTAKAVGLFIEQSLAEILRIADELNLFALQIYGKTIPTNTPYKTIQPIAMIEENLAVIQNSTADYVLLDTHHPTLLGGSGAAFDWSLIPPHHDNIFLAGGINPSNVRAALACKPYALDLCSGVEQFPGKKDPKKILQLFEEINSC